MRNQVRRAGLGLAQPMEQGRDQQDIRDAFLGMAKHLRARPAANVTPFNEAGGQRQTPGWALIRAARACLDAAREKGGDAPRGTVAEVALYFDTLKTIALRGYDCGSGSAECVVLEFARQASEAHAAVTRLAVERSPAAAMDARREVLEVIPAAEQFARIDRQLSSHPQSLGAVR
jgi:hypothetical protein